MRLFVFMALRLALGAGVLGCAEDATAADACENVGAVCTGNANLQTVKTACESAVTGGKQSVLNCIESANTCDEALACTTTN